MSSLDCSKNMGLLFIIAKLYYNHEYNNKLLTIDWGISVSCWLGLSSRPGLTQRREGVQGRYAPLSLGYLQAGVVTMAPTAVDTMSSWCSVRFIKVDLVCNLKRENSTKSRTVNRFFRSIFLIGTIVESEKVARLQMTNSERRQIQIMN